MKGRLSPSKRSAPSSEIKISQKVAFRVSTVRIEEKGIDWKPAKGKLPYIGSFIMMNYSITSGTPFSWRIILTAANWIY
jgi:hypothetical protein